MLPPQSPRGPALLRVVGGVPAAIPQQLLWHHQSVLGIAPKVAAYQNTRYHIVLPGGLVGGPRAYYSKINLVGSRLTECILKTTFSCIKLDKRKARKRGLATRYIR